MVDNNDTGHGLKKIVISPDDCQSALDFWRHFNIPVPPDLYKAIEDFSDNPTLESQEKVKYEVCKAICTTNHAAFKDDFFTKIVEECKIVAFNMTFDNDLEKTLSEE
jgi:hypothetical protein